MPNLEIPRWFWDTIRLMLMVPFIVIMVFIKLGTGSRRTETRIIIDEGPLTFVFTAKIQRRGDVQALANGTGASNRNNRSRGQDQHNRQEDKKTREDHKTQVDQTEEDDIVEPSDRRTNGRFWKGDNLRYDDSPTEEVDDDDGEDDEDSEDEDDSEDDDSRPSIGLQLDESELDMDESFHISIEEWARFLSSRVDAQGDIHLPPESTNMTVPTGRAPRSLSDGILVYPPAVSNVSVPVRQENVRPAFPAVAMIQTARVDEIIPSDIETMTLTTDDKKEMPFAVMQSHVFDLNGDSTETEGSGLEF